MRDTIAIVGSHPRTRSQFDYSRDDCDVWVFNEALRADWCKRADAVFQMHKPVIWKNPKNRNDPKHYDWLRSGQTPPIYMMEAYEEVPNAVKYPLDEVLQITPGIRYLTSSVAYAIALAIHLGYKRMELYGVEMETNTEYHYQRQGVAFWIGVALGRGIDVRIDTKLFDDPIYGYEGDKAIPYDEFERIVTESAKQCQDAETRYCKERDELNVTLQSIIDAIPQDKKKLVGQCVGLSMTATQFGFADGKRQEAERYKGKADTMIAEAGDYIFSRQEFEQMIVTHGKARDNEVSKANAYAGKLQALYEDMLRINNKRRRAEKMKLFAEALKVYIESSTKVGVYDGASKINLELLNITDKLIRASGGIKSFEAMAEAVVGDDAIMETVDV